MSPTPDALSAAAARRARLEDAARGLLYTSESDRPFEVVSFERPAGDLTPAAFAAAAGSPGVRAEEQTLDQFLARHIERAPADDAALQTLKGKFEALKRALRDSLVDVRVFRVGEVEVHCYAVGDDGAGRLAGVHTVSVET